MGEEWTNDVQPENGDAMKTVSPQSEESSSKTKSTMLTNNIDKCPTCGGRLDWSQSELGKDGRRYVECSRCHNKYSDGSGKWTPEVQSYLTQAMIQYRNGAFEDAIDILDSAIALAPNCYEAYWNKLLANNGIIYVEDNGFKPTCNRANFSSLYDQQDYKKAMEYAPEHMQASYKAQADVVEAIRKEIIELVEKEDPYDIFISFKKTKLNSKEPTADSYFANEIYNDLKDKYKVFYSEKSLKDAAGTSFEPTIFRALQSAKVFILICSKAEYANAVWVKNEWSRYLRMMKDGLKKDETLVLVFPDNYPEGLPSKLSGIQGIKYHDRTYDKQMEDFITRSLAKYPSSNNIVRKTFSDVKNFGPKKEMDASLQIERKEFVGQKVDVADTAVISMAKKLLEQSNFSGAEQLCRGVLLKNKHSAAAKLYCRYAQEGIRNDSEYIKGYSSRVNCIKWLDEILQNCTDREVFQKIIDIVKAICDRAIADKNTDVIVESFNLVAQWAPEKDVDAIRETLLGFSKSVIKQSISNNALATSIFDCVLRTYGDNEVEKYAHMNYEFARCLHDVRLFEDALPYYNKSLDLIDDSQCYFDRMLAANGLVRNTDRVKAKQVSEEELENILKYAQVKTSVKGSSSAKCSACGSKLDWNDAKLGEDGKYYAECPACHNKYSDKSNKIVVKDMRAKVQTDLVNFALIQGNEGAFDIATKVFDYVIQFVPQEDKVKNKKYLIPFADMLLSMEQYDLAKMYYGPMINIDDLCHEAHWGMLKADHRCKDDRALLYCEDDFSVEEHYIKALYGSSTDQDAYMYYISFNEMKLMLYESVIEKAGWELLANGEFQGAKERFNTLLSFEMNTRKRKISSHPECYWGRLLADAECRSDMELFEKRECFSMERIQEHDDCVKYLQAYGQQKDTENQFYYEGNFGKKKPPITQEEYIENILPSNVNHLKVLEAINLTHERKSYINTRQNEFAAMKSNIVNSFNAVKRNARGQKHGAVVKKNLATFILVLLMLGVVAAVAYGCSVFYTYDVSGDWYSTLRNNLPMVFGICIGVLGGVGAIIAFIVSRSEYADMEETVGYLIGGIIIGGLAGLAAVGIVFASCWALVPLAGLAIIIGCCAIIKAIDRSALKRVNARNEVIMREVRAKAAEFKTQQNNFITETTMHIKSSNRMISMFAAANGIDLVEVGIDEFTADNIRRNFTSDFEYEKLEIDNEADDVANKIAGYGVVDAKTKLRNRIVTILCDVVLLVIAAVAIVLSLKCGDFYSTVHWGVVLGVALGVLVGSILMLTMGKQYLRKRGLFIVCMIIAVLSTVWLLLSPLVFGIEIKDAKTFNALANCITADFELKNDIDLAGVEVKRTKDFLGYFNGNGYTVSNMKVKDYWIRNNKGTIRNVKFENMEVTASKNSQNGIALINTNEEDGNIDTVAIHNAMLKAYGGTNALLVGKNKGEVSKIYVDGLEAVVDNTNHDSECTVGGIVGVNAKSMGECGIENSIFTDEDVSDQSYLGVSYLGGLCGRLEGYITNSYAYSITINMAGGYYSGIVGVCAEGTVSYCYSQSIVARSSGLSGVAGYVTDSLAVNYCYSDRSNLSSCYYDSSYAEVNQNSYLTLRDTTLSSFASSYFGSSWDNRSAGHPILAWDFDYPDEDSSVDNTDNNGKPIGGTLTNGSNSVSIDGDYKYFRFTPSSSGTYTISSSSSSGDPLAVLCNSSWEQITRDDDSGSGSNFSMSAQLTAGQTYYIGIKEYHESSVTIIVSIEGGGGNNGNNDNNNDNSDYFQVSGTLSYGGNSVMIDSSKKYYKFIPTSSDTYTISSNSSSDDPKAEFYNAQGTRITGDDDGGSGNNFSMTAQLTAGQTYYVAIWNLNSSSMTISVNIEGSNTDYFQVSGTLSDGGNSVSIDGNYSCKYYKFIPTLSGTYTISSSSSSGDPEAALYNAQGMRITGDDDSGGGRDFSMSAQLTARQTYYVAIWNRGSSSMTISVNIEGSNTDYFQVSGTLIDGGNSVTIDGNKKYYKFIPTSSGTYTISSSSSSGDPKAELYNTQGTKITGDDDSGSGRNFIMSAQLTAGQTYYVAIWNLNSSSVTISVYING